MHLTGIAFGGLRPFGAGAGHVLVAQRLILREPAGIDQHPQPRADPPGLAIDFGDHPGDLALFDDQLLYRSVGSDIDPGGKARLEHPPLERCAGGGPVLEGQLAEDRAQNGAAIDPRVCLALGAEGGLHPVVEPGRKRQEPRAQLLLPRAEFLEVEVPGGDAAAGLAAARRVVVVIGPKARTAFELDAPINQKVDHSGRHVDIGETLLVVRSGQILAHRIEIGDRLFGALVGLFGSDEAVVRDPHHPARLGGGAADVGRLFADRHRVSGPAHHQPRDHRAGAAADHDPVEHFVEIAHRHPVREPRIDPRGAPGTSVDHPRAIISPWRVARRAKSPRRERDIQAGPRRAPP